MSQCSGRNRANRQETGQGKDEASAARHTARPNLTLWTLSDIAAPRAEARCRKIKNLANMREDRALNGSRVKAGVGLTKRKTETKMKTYRLKLRHIERRPPRCHFDALTPL